ncbi:MAG: glycosyltransferase family 39 protein [Streptosporangiales bacterium]|nr:glycosyltransferase family 39 protein [Streptosporangiales bacterium]
MSTAVADPLLYPADLSSQAPSRRRRRWEVWRSPDDQPAWARPLLLVTGAIAAALFAWNIADAGLAPFYSVAVKSMSESWKAFFYGAFDPKATITIDKLAGSFAPQALSARIFGFHAWSLALPQVIEGVLSVLLMYRMVRRWAGAVPGLLAALLFALTPIVASTMGHSMEDGALTFCLVLAADQWTRAVTDGRLRSLLWAGFWVGVGFQCKMLEAWMALPALGLAYLFCASGSWGRRVRDLALFGVVTLATSLSWILLYTFTPAADRPYVDGSTNNSAWSMVFGYNGLERFGITVPGAVDSGPGMGGGMGGRAGGASHQFPGAGMGGRAFGGGGMGHGGFGGQSGFGSGWTKLFGSEFGPQIGWLLPLVILTLICGVAWTWRSQRTDKVKTGFVFWGLWFLTFFAIYSDMSSIPHTAYVATLAPAIAALSAVGIVVFWRAYRAGGRRGWLLPAAVVLSLAWAVFLWNSYSGFLPWALWTAVGVGAVAVGIMIWARMSRKTALRIATAGLIAGTVAMLTPSATWAASVLDTSYAGSSFNAGAGPDSGMGGGMMRGSGKGGNMGEMAERFRMGGGFGGGMGGGMMGAAQSLTSSEKDLDNYVNAHRGNASYLMAVSSWSEASPYILSTGQEVLAMGGFSGSVPEPTLAKVRQLVKSGQLKFFLLNSTSSSGSSTSAGKSGSAMGGGGAQASMPGGAGGGGFMGRGNSAADKAIDSWVEKSCTAVPAKDYGGTASSASSASGSAMSGPGPSGTSSSGPSSSGTSSSSAGAQTGPGGMGTGMGSTSSEKLYECKS